MIQETITVKFGGLAYACHLLQPKGGFQYYL